MSRQGRQSDIKAKPFQISLDERHHALLEEIVKTGRYGRNVNDAAARLVIEWLAANANDEIRKYDTFDTLLKERRGGGDE
jgi:hypothetical protein